MSHMYKFMLFAKQIKRSGEIVTCYYWKKKNNDNNDKKKNANC